MNFLCISNEFKGQDFLTFCKKEGNNVFLVTSKEHENDAWPREAIDEMFFMEKDDKDNWSLEDLVLGTAYLMRSKKIDRIVALDDFDVEKAAHLREVFRIPGMGETTHRYFRDKLAMRVKAAEEGINVPGFSGLFNDEAVNEFIRTVPAPWVVKPRGKASASGIKKVHSGEELWQVIHSLGEERHLFLVEQFAPGDVFHTDAICVDGKPVFCRVSQYLNTPLEVAHGGGVFRSCTVEFGSDLDKKLQKLTAEVMKAFGMQFSASHTEFIRSAETGEFYFLETSSRVGGAHLAEMVEASSGINLWGEWARLETAEAKGIKYKLPKVRNDYAGILVSLSRYAHPDSSSFTAPEICWRLNKEYHIGMILKSNDRQRILGILDDYAHKVFNDFHASAPAD
ncbi:MAG: ATPase [Bacteroidota bacterium]